MGKLKIKAAVYYLNMEPVAGASVKIFDHDVDGNHDLIFTKVTNQSGECSGLSLEWKEGFLDQKDLRFEVTYDGKFHKGPFIHLSDYKSLPIVTPYIKFKPQGKLDIKGKVQFINFEKAVDAKIKIYDQNLDGSKDLILDVNTDSEGKFSGKSKEWKTSSLDIMNLYFEATIQGKKHTGPFIFLGPDKSVPIILPFFSDKLDDSEVVPTDTEWHLKHMSVKKAWNLQPTIAGGKIKGEGIVIGHPDTGWHEHAEFNETQLLLNKAYNVITDKEGKDATRHLLEGPNNSHGTATGSIIISKEADSDKTTVVRPQYNKSASGEIHITGIAPQSKILPIKCVDETYVGGIGVVRVLDDYLIKAIKRAIITKVDVVSISLGGSPKTALKKEIDNAVLKHNIIVIAAAGQIIGRILDPLRTNFGDIVVEPAAYQNVIAATATTPNKKPWAMTGNGPNVDIAVPGHCIWLADFKDKKEVINNGSGTSFSTSLLAGAAALWLAYWGKDHLLKKYTGVPLSHVFRYLIKKTADDLNNTWDKRNYGAGILNVEALLKEQLPHPQIIPIPPKPAANLISGISGLNLYK